MAAITMGSVLPPMSVNGVRGGDNHPREVQRSDGVNPESNLHTKLLKMIHLVNIHLNHFPKHEKYGLCQQIRNCMYDIYNLVTECQKRYHKKTSLTNLDIKHEQLRMMIMLAYELGYYKYKNGKKEHGQKEESRRYLAASILINEVGAMVGGWIKKSNLK